MIANSVSDEEMSEVDPSVVMEPVVQMLADSVLLRRFVQDSDQTAFAEIVRRHGSLVMAVCRRVVGQVADADDAFQATFLALAHRPRSVRQCRSLTGWLYSVAFRTSLRLVRVRSRHAMLTVAELPAVREPDPLEVIAADRETAVLDEELNRLPEKYRNVLVMTYFNAQSSQQIADQLNESKGTIDGRLRQARNVLRVRLARRGVALTVIAIAAATQAAACSAASPTLIQATIGLGVQALGYPVPFPVNLSRLEPLFKPELTMLRTKLITGLVLTAVAIAGGISAGSSGDATASVLEESGALIESTVDNNQESESSTSVPQSQVTGQQATAKSTIQSAVARNNYSGYSSATTRTMADRIYRDLAQSRVELNFPEEVSLDEVLAKILESVDPPPPMMVDHAGLAPHGILSLQDVTVRGFVFNGISAQSALDVVLSQTTDPQLDYIVRDEVLVITSETVANSNENLFRRAYNVAAVLPLFESDVPMWRVVPLSPTGGAGEQGFSQTSRTPGMPVATDNSKPLSTEILQRQLDISNVPPPVVDSSGAMYHYEPVTPQDRLLDTVQRMSEYPCRWFDVDGEGGRISAMQNSIIVLQTRRGHKTVVDILEQLEQMATTAAR